MTEGTKRIIAGYIDAYRLLSVKIWPAWSWPKEGDLWCCVEWIKSPQKQK